MKSWRKKIYLDTAAATPLDPRARRAMAPYLSRQFANPSSIHAGGVAARAALEESRAALASVLNAHPDEIILTSGGTEANNLALLGVSAPHLVTTVIEHSSVLAPARALERRGVAVTYLPVNDDGLVRPEDLAKALRPETRLVSIAYANSELGVVQPIRELAKVIRQFRKKHKLQNPKFHIDACQASRFLDLSVERLGVDLLTLNGGKIYGPKGVGALYCRRGVPLEPLSHGGGQERGRRSGTENVPAAVGLARALGLCEAEREREAERLTKLRDYFTERLLALPDVKLNGSAAERLPNNVNVSFLGADSEFVVLNLDAAGVACSAGSACSSHERSTSYVVRAVTGSEARAASAVRFTLDRKTRRSDLGYVLKVLAEVLPRARSELSS